MDYGFGLENVHNYAEMTIKTELQENDLVELVAYITAKNELYNDFMLYEANYSINIGLRILVKNNIQKDKILSELSDAKEMKIHSINEDLYKVFKNISIKEWRVYRLVDFDYSKYIYSHKNVYTFPLAGTRAIDKDSAETERLKMELETDTKEIAEHAVSVKLAFEELQNCCEFV